MAEPGQQEIKAGDKGVFEVPHVLFAYISNRCHVSLRLKIFINSLVMAFPAFVQYIFFDEPEYLISFVLCFGLVSSTFLLTRARLILTLPFVLISLIYTMFLVMYSKSLGITSIMALVDTKVEDMFGFLISPGVIIVTFAFIIVLAFYIRFIILNDKDDEQGQLIPKSKRYVPIAGIIFVLVFFFFENRYFTKAYPFSLMHDSSSYLKIVAEMEESEKKGYSFSGTLENGFREKTGSFIIIVGESSRRASWSLYGYKRKTNVFLKAMCEKYPENFILFRDYLATGQSTYPNLMSIFSVLPSKEFADIPRYPSFVKILGYVAYKTFFVSTYGNIFLKYIHADENIITGASDDDDLLPVLDKILEDRNYQKKFIIMHLKGSHFAFSDYNYSFKDYIFPSDDPLMDKYDNSIVHTDLFLKNIAEKVMKSDEPLFVWYMPDHGENLNDFGDGNFGHGCAGFTCFELELPSIIFFNNAFLGKNPAVANVFKNRNYPISHSNIAHTMMGLCGIYPREYRKTFDLSSRQYRNEERYVIDCDLFPARYSRANIQK
jgi:glucan phosphoethanolaminetransferase (alkaline phosphatase superfamily)